VLLVITAPLSGPLCSIIAGIVLEALGYRDAGMAIELCGDHTQTSVIMLFLGVSTRWCSLREWFNEENCICSSDLET